MQVPNLQFYDPNERLNKTCPKCGSDKISFLMHSIFFDEAERELVKSGEIALMGCLYHEPYNLGCRNCEHAWASVPMTVEGEWPKGF